MVWTTRHLDLKSGTFIRLYTYSIAITGTRSISSCNNNLVNYPHWVLTSTNPVWANLGRISYQLLLSIYRSILTLLISWSIRWWAVFSTTSGGSLGCGSTFSTCSYTCHFSSLWQFSHYSCWLLNQKHVSGLFLLPWQAAQNTYMHMWHVLIFV